MHATNGASSNDEDEFFRENFDGGKLKNIGIYLNIMKRQEHWSIKTCKDIRHHSYDYFLRDNLLWKRPKK